MSLPIRRTQAAPWLKDGLWRKAQAAPSLDLRFSDNKSLVDSVSGQNLVTFTRASSATYIGSDGLLKTATTNEPRFDHNPITGESLGLLVEEQRTNLLLQSNGFGTTWSTSNTASLTSNAGTAPDGTNSAWELKDTVDSIVIQHQVAQAISFTSGTTYTLSCWAKKSSLAFAGFTLPPGPFGSTLVARFDLNNGSVVTTPSGGTCTITPFPNGWYRCTLSATATTTSTQSLAIRTSNSSTSSYQGDGTGTIFVWGTQLEVGSFPTSYIPTTTAATTRAADVASITGSAFSSWYRQDEGTWFAQHDVRNMILSANNNNFTERQPQMGLGAGLAHDFYSITGNVIQANSVGAAHVVGTTDRVAYALKINDFRGALNGALFGAVTSGSFGSSITQLNIGALHNGASTADGTIRRITYFPARLPNTTLQRITQ